MRRRARGDPWYTVLYKDPAEWWWMPPVVSGLSGTAVYWLLSRSLDALGVMIAAIAVGLPLARVRFTRPASDTRSPNVPLSRPGDPY